MSSTTFSSTGRACGQHWTSCRSFLWSRLEQEANDGSDLAGGFLELDGLTTESFNGFFDRGGSWGRQGYTSLSGLGDAIVTSFRRARLRACTLRALNVP